jgi:hypothetical protein
MRLWSYQRSAVGEALARGAVLRGDWARVDSLWLPAYRELVRRRGWDAPPVWAWHSWAAWQDVPNDEAASSLLSESELAEGVVRLVLDVPDPLALLSSYGVWNQIFDEMDEPLGPPEDLAAMWDALFDVREALPGCLPIQATLPRLEPAWVVSCEPLEP